MNTHKAVAAACLLGAPTPAHAGLGLIDLLPGYTLGELQGLSADGTTLAVDMLVSESIRYDAYAWRDGQWSSLPRVDRFNLWQGISADGSVTLSVSSQWGARPRLIRVEDGVREHITFGTDDRELNAAITRDGQTVFYTMGGQASGPVDVLTYAAGSGRADLVATLDERYDRVIDVIAGDRDDLFVINSAVRPAGVGFPGTERALLYDDGRIFEIPTLSDDAGASTWASDMTADGSVIVGVETRIDLDTYSTTSKSWIYQDNRLRELVVDGLTDTSISSITDDATAMIVSGRSQTDGSYSSFLLYEGGRRVSAAELLAAEGLVLGMHDTAVLNDISGNGLVVSGVISSGVVTPFGPELTLFTINVPAPPSGLALVLMGYAGRRRR